MVLLRGEWKHDLAEAVVHGLTVEDQRVRHSDVLVRQLSTARRRVRCVVRSM
jgi:hypothetical protein